jgi:CelD/BcsL family acetyltransferase involved in cellulose biosynthesis
MSGRRVLTLSSVAQLRGAAADWDDLWWRSEVTLPVARAELLAQWIEHFAPGARFRALVVEKGGRWVAALPLVESPRGRRLGAAGLPGNEWCPGGDLLLDPQSDAAAVLAALVSALRDLPWPWLWLQVTLDASRWQRFAAVADHAGMASDCRPDWYVPVIPITHDWEACQQGWSKKHLTKMVKAERHLAERGRVEFCDYSHLGPNEVPPWLRRAFEIEDLSWKGAAGTSVLRAPGMLEFFVRQAQQLADWGQLELAFLAVGGRPISFVYGFRGKGVCYWHKIGYDPEFRCSTPGQLLQYHVLKRLHDDPGCHAVDCLGPLTDALAKWKPGVRTAGRLLVAPGAWRGRLAVHACRHWWPRIRRLLGRPAPPPLRYPGAAPSPATAGQPVSASPS